MALATELLGVCATRLTFIFFFNNRNNITIIYEDTISQVNRGFRRGPQ